HAVMLLQDGVGHPTKLLSDDRERLRLAVLADQFPVPGLTVNETSRAASGTNAVARLLLSLVIAGTASGVFPGICIPLRPM
ncbi:MAG: hypothetical protein KAU31_04410, partial [Spirochaetaceae bacterium]|nr:hypothetical protein [Spirochaetaceae bacterium]